MSWSIIMVGKKADVKAAANAEQYLPQCLKDVVAKFCDEGADDPEGPEAVQLETSGHFGGAHSNIYHFRLNPVVLAKPPS
jgi:hypothetical protein